MGQAITTLGTNALGINNALMHMWRDTHTDWANRFQIQKYIFPGITFCGLK